MYHCWCLWQERCTESASDPGFQASVTAEGTKYADSLRKSRLKYFKFSWWSFAVQEKETVLEISLHEDKNSLTLSMSLIICSINWSCLKSSPLLKIAFRVKNGDLSLGSVYELLDCSFAGTLAGKAM